MSQFRSFQKRSTRLVSEEQLIRSRDKLPCSHAVVTQSLQVLARPTADISELAAVVAQDPGTAAHLLRAANSALFGTQREVRSLERAIAQLGLDRTKMHILGVSIRPAFASGPVRALWDHSIEVAGMARALAETTAQLVPEEACLAGLLHDVGALVFAGLGDPYRNAYAALRARQVLPLEAERQLCGYDHAHAGADLLEAWMFPPDLVDSVRYHHAPCLTDQPLASHLYLAESWSERDEDAGDPIEHKMARQFLGLSLADLRRASSRPDSDLATLRLAA